jgi:hypothetical protein
VRIHYGIERAGGGPLGLARSEVAGWCCPPVVVIARLQPRESRPGAVSQPHSVRGSSNHFRHSKLLADDCSPLNGLQWRQPLSSSDLCQEQIHTLVASYIAAHMSCGSPIEIA